MEVVMSSVLTIRVPEDLQQELGGLAEMTGRSRSWLAAEAIREYLERERWQIAEIHDAIAEADTGDFAKPEETAAVFAKWARRAS
jgi:RHH-type rel operon transcriptional repressor/antitoxin RelB